MNKNAPRFRRSNAAPLMNKFATQLTKCNAKLYLKNNAQLKMKWNVQQPWSRSATQSLKTNAVQ
jgi:hypothetical protein